MHDDEAWAVLRSGLETIEPSLESWQLVEQRLASAMAAEHDQAALRRSGRAAAPLRGGLRRLPRGQRRLPPGRRRLAFAGAGLAAAVAAAIAIPAVLPSHTPGSAPIAGAAVLEEAAAVAATRPAGSPGPGQYLYLETIEGSAVSIGQALGRPRSGSAPNTTRSLRELRRQVWISSDGSGRELITTLPADGSGAVRDTLMPAGSFAQAMTYPDRLPTEPAVLRTAIVDRFEGGHNDDAATFHFAGSFLQADATPELRAALYRMIATLPGVQATGTAVDQQGRTGISVTLGDAGQREELIFDPRSSAVLEERDLDKHGSLVRYVVYLASGVSNSRTNPAG